MYNIMNSRATYSETPIEVLYEACLANSSQTHLVRVIMTSGTWTDAVVTSFLLAPQLSDVIVFTIVTTKNDDGTKTSRLVPGVNSTTDCEGAGMLFLTLDELLPEDREISKVIDLRDPECFRNSDVNSRVPLSMAGIKNYGISDGEYYIIKLVPNDISVDEPEYLVQGRSFTDEVADDHNEGKNPKEWEFYTEGFDYWNVVTSVLVTTNEEAIGASATSEMLYISHKESGTLISAKTNTLCEQGKAVELDPGAIFYSEEELPEGRAIWYIRHATTVDIARLKPDWMEKFLMEHEKELNRFRENGEDKANAGEHLDAEIVKE